MKHIKLLAAVGIVFLFILSGVNAQTAQIKKPAPTTPGTKIAPKTPITKKTPTHSAKTPAAESKSSLNDARISFAHPAFDFGVVPPGSQVC